MIVELYAGTEAQAVTVIDGAEWLEHPGSVGRVVSGEMRVAGLDGDGAPPGEVGEIWMRPPPDRTTYRYIGADARARDGWESLGDMGWFDADGYLYLSDRPGRHDPRGRGQRVSRRGGGRSATSTPPCCPRA